MKTNLKLAASFLASGLSLIAPATQAADWSDTYIGYRYGADFREPNNPNDVRKNVLQFTHISGYATGQNFLNLDILQSDDMDPANGGSTGATEFYATYRHQFHLGKLLDKNLAFGPVKEVAATAGFDLNTKNTAFAPRKRLLVAGPTLKFDVPGVFDISLLLGKEWNHCGLNDKICPTHDISFDTQFIVSAGWMIPFSAGPVPMKFQGFGNYMSKKGKDYAGVETAPETLIRTSLMVDVGQIAFSKKNLAYVGIGYEYWHNKFGNHNDARGNEKVGINTHTPTIQAELHF